MDPIEYGERHPTRAVALVIVLCLALIAVSYTVAKIGAVLFEPAPSSHCEYVDDTHTVATCEPTP